MTTAEAAFTASIERNQGRSPYWTATDTAGLAASFDFTFPTAREQCTGTADCPCTWHKAQHEKEAFDPFDIKALIARDAKLSIARDIQYMQQQLPRAIELGMGHVWVEEIRNLRRDYSGK